jgi:hypothetical protein
MFIALSNTSVLYLPHHKAKFAGAPHPPFDFAVVDEAQDIDVAELRFLAALGANRPNALFFAGDLGQRIFQQPFSWKASAWMSVAAPPTCASTTEPPTRSGPRLTGYSVPKSPMWMATPSSGTRPFRSSTGPCPRCWYSTPQKMKSRPSADGSPTEQDGGFASRDADRSRLGINGSRSCLRPRSAHAGEYRDTCVL